MLRFELITPLLCALVLCALAWGSSTSGAAEADEAPFGVRPTAPKDLKELEARLDALNARIAELMAAAQRDPAELKIAAYRKYGPKELKKTRGRIRAEDLVPLMADPTKNFTAVREAAQKAIIDGAKFKGDPDLSDTEKSGRMTKRAGFAYKELTGFLKDKDVDRLTRKLVHDLLCDLYPQARNAHPEVRAYSADGSGTWAPAYNEWRNYLKKQ